MLPKHLKLLTSQNLMSNLHIGLSVLPQISQYSTVKSVWITQCSRFKFENLHVIQANMLASMTLQVAGHKTTWPFHACWLSLCELTACPNEGRCHWVVITTCDSCRRTGSILSPSLPRSRDWSSSWKTQVHQQKDVISWLYNSFKHSEH